jgi:CPA1 family monovalent cation:H+ antiporter
MLLLLISLAGFGLLARKLQVPEPIVLVLGGLAVSFIPGLPQIELKPDYVFLIVLPPLLHAQAWFTSWKDFRDHLRAITLLAVGLVLFTTTAVAFIAHALVPELPLAAAFVLGAIVSPPDAIAASAIAQRLRLPRQLVTILEGESLINDATGLVAYKFALVAVATGAFSLPKAAGGFVLVAAGGVAVGLLVGWLLAMLLRWIRDDLIDIVLSLVGPYVAYLGAEQLHVSGVLATVAGGIYLGARSPELLSASARLTGAAFWNTLVFLLNGVVFMLIGLQLPGVVRSLHRHSWLELLGHAALIGAVVIVTRLLWVYPGAYLPRWISPRIRTREPRPALKNVTVIGWCGMRGVVSLAAALAVPHALPSGADFPERDLILFFTFAVILTTLVGQGLTLPLVIRRLHVGVMGSEHDVEREARAAVARAAVARIERAAKEQELSDDARDDAAARYHERLGHLNDELAETLGWSPQRQRAVETRRLRREALGAERRELIVLYRTHRISKELLHKLERELDLEETRLG